MNFIYANLLLAAEWRSARELVGMSVDDMRNTLIVELNNRSTESIASLQAQNNDELAWHALMYLWLVEAQIRSPQQLATMSLDNQRNTTILENHKHTGRSIPYLQAYNNWQLTEIASAWWLQSYLKPLIDKLNNVKGAKIAIHNLKDDGGRTMDTLKVLKLNSTSYLGIYHTLVNGVFQLQVAKSSDLKKWTRIAELGGHSHQGDIKRMGSGFLVANEQDIQGQGNNIRLRYYKSLNKLKANQPEYDKSIPRTFSQAAEGTPNIRSIVGTDPAQSVILIGFHYWKDQIVDRLATGVLSNFSQWKPWIDVIANQAIESMKFEGNIGGRYAFSWKNATWFIQEAQVRPNDWAAWRLLLGNGRFYIQLDLDTNGGSSSFANPSITNLSSNRYVANTFLHGQASAPGESGQLLYVFHE